MQRFTLLDLEQGSDHWKIYRGSKIGASDAGVIMNLNPHCTAYTLWKQKLGIEEVNDNFAMRLGRDLEPKAREFFNNMFDVNMKPLVGISTENDFMMASMDGIDMRNHFAIEIKCGLSAHEKAKNDVIPEYYYAQMQHQMYVFGLEKINYGTYLSDDEYTISLIERDDKFIEKMIDLEKDFHYCLSQLIVPKLTKGDFMDRSDDPTWLELTTQYNKNKEVMDRLKLENDEIKEQLIAISEQKPSKGNGVTLSMANKAGSVDFAALKKDGIDIDKYRKQSTTYWRLNGSKTA